MKKKNMYFLSLFLIGFFLCFIITGCGENSNGKHIHEFSLPWFNNETNHWKECSCGEKSEEEAHSFGQWITINEPTETVKGSKKRVCSICNYEQIEDIDVVAHMHTYSQEWSYDRNNHWHKATCQHDFDVRVIDFEEHTLNENRECEICHYVRPIEQLEFQKNGSGYEVAGIGNLYEMDVVIPETYNGLAVTSIADNAFKGTNITSLVVPNSVTHIGKNAFIDCIYLKSLTLPFIGEDLNSERNNYFSYLFGGTKESGLIWTGQGLSLEDVTITQAKTIPNNAFFGCSRVDKIVLPEGITSVGSEAFAGCSDLIEVNIPNSVQEIGWNAFSNCFKLKEMNIPYGVTTIKNGAFRRCESLKEIEIPNSVIDIEMYSFSHCINLEKLILPNSVKTIGEEAFYDCGKLKELTLSNQLTAIDKSVFSECRSLSKVVIPDSVTSIGFWAFSNCFNLLSIVVGQQVKAINQEAFIGCHSLVEIYNLSSFNFDNMKNLEDTVMHTSLLEPSIIKKDNDYQYITKNNQNYIIQYLGSEIDLTLPKMIGGKNYGIYKGAFSGSQIQKITIPDEVFSIEKSAFSQCYFLKEAILGNGIRYIDDYAFNYCLKLEKIQLGNQIKRIGNYAFHSNNVLKEITLPKSITTLGEGVFALCDELMELSYEGTTTAFNSIKKAEKWDLLTKFNKIVCSNGSLNHMPTRH